MITLGTVIGMVMLAVIPALIPRQNGDAQMRFDEIVSAQRRGVEDKLRGADRHMVQGIVHCTAGVGHCGAMG